MIDILGSRLPGMDVPEEEEATGDAALMNGPQAPDKAISQDDIDKLLAEFDWFICVNKFYFIARDRGLSLAYVFFLL